MSRLTCTAVVLRTRPYGESDLIVDLFTESHGRTSVIAKGALRSKKRYMGVLELGHILKVDYLIKPQLSVLGPCDIIHSHWKLRQSLKALRQLYYILEICLVATPYEEQDTALFQSLVELLSALESEPGLDESYVFTWEMRLFSHLGYQVTISRCPLSGEAPDGFSALTGGTISAKVGKPYWPVNREALRTLYKLQYHPEIEFNFESLFSSEEEQQIRHAFAGLWSAISGTSLKSLGVFETLNQQNPATPVVGMTS